MSNRTHTTVWFLLLVLGVVLAGSTWQSAVLTDSKEQISINGFGAFPASGLALGFNVLAMFTLRYAKGLGRYLLLPIIATITAFALFAPAKAALDGTPILSKIVEAATGVAGWQEQQAQVLDQVQPYSLAAYAFSGFVIVLAVWIFAGIFGKSERTKTRKPSSSEDLWLN